MKRFAICILTAFCLLTASAVNGLCCGKDNDCGSSLKYSAKQSNDQHNDVGSHTCCHAHNVFVKADNIILSEAIGIVPQYIIVQHELITQFQPGILLEPPSHA